MKKKVREREKLSKNLKDLLKKKNEKKKNTNNISSDVTMLMR